MIVVERVLGISKKMLINGTKLYKLQNVGIAALDILEVVILKKDI